MKGSYKDYIFEIEKEKAHQVVIKNAIPNSDCPDLLPISEMNKVEPLTGDEKIEEDYKNYIV